MNETINIGSKIITSWEFIDTLKSGGNISLSSPAGQYRAMLRCPSLFSSILKRSSSIRNGRIEVDGSEKKMMLNSVQSIIDFVVEIELALCVFGRAYVRAIDIIGFKGMSALDILENTKVTENRNNEEIIGYSYTKSGIVTKLTLDEVYVIDDVEGLSRFGNGTPISRMKAIEGEIKSTALSSELCVDLLANRGALGIISMVNDKDPVGNNPQTKSERDSIYKRFVNAYGVLTGKMKFVLSYLDSKFTKISADMGEMGLDEMAKRDIERITEQYEVPRILLGMSDSTFANLAEAKSFFYQSVIIPRAEKIAEFLSLIIGKEVKIFYDHLDVFQVSKKEQAEANTATINYVNLAKESGLMTDAEAIEEFNRLRT